MTDPVASFRCLNIEFDIYNNESISIDNKFTYYLTPKLFAKIEKWMIDNNIQQIVTQEQIDFLVNNGYFGTYPSKPLTRIIS